MKNYSSSIIIAILIIVLLPVGAFSQAGIVEGETVSAETGTKLSPISIYDEENLLKISIEDVGKYHGDLCPCAIVGFRATQLAISQLWKPARPSEEGAGGDEIPERKDFRIISALPAIGSQDAFEFITRVKTRGDFTLQLPPGTDIANISIENWVFTFIRKSTGKQIKVWLKEEVFPGGSEEFFRLRKKVKFEGTATPEEKEAFKSAKQELKKAFIILPLDNLFDFKKKVN